MKAVNAKNKKGLKPNRCPLKNQVFRQQSVKALNKKMYQNYLSQISTQFQSVSDAYPLTLSKRHKTKSKSKSKSPLTKKKKVQGKFHDLKHSEKTIQANITSVNYPNFIENSYQKTTLKGNRRFNNLSIDCSSKYQLNGEILQHENLRLNFKRKHEAAIKIQKCFRGHLTRKFLTIYIEQQEKRLSDQLVQRQFAKNGLQPELSKYQQRADTASMLHIFNADTPKQKFISQQFISNSEQEANQNMFGKTVSSKDVNFAGISRQIEMQSKLMENCKSKQYFNSYSQEGRRQDQSKSQNQYEQDQEYCQEGSRDLNLALQQEFPPLVKQQLSYQQRVKQDIQLPSVVEYSQLKKSREREKSGDHSSRSQNNPKQVKNSSVQAQRVISGIKRDRCDTHHIESYRRLQYARWNQMIELLNSQMDEEHKGNTWNKKCLAELLKVAIQNKEELGLAYSEQCQTPTDATHHRDSQSRPETQSLCTNSHPHQIGNSQQSIPSFKKKSLKIQTDKPNSPFKSIPYNHQLINQQIQSIPFGQSSNDKNLAQIQSRFMNKHAYIAEEEIEFYENQNQGIDIKESEYITYSNIRKRQPQSDSMSSSDLSAVSQIRSEQAEEQAKKHIPIIVTRLRKPHSFLQKRVQKFLSEDIISGTIQDLFLLSQTAMEQKEHLQISKLYKYKASYSSTSNAFDNAYKLNSINQENDQCRQIQRQKRKLKKMKQQVIKGVRAQQDLEKQIMNDAKLLGIKIFPSKSAQSLKKSNFSIFCSIIVDELQKKDLQRGTPSLQQSSNTNFLQYSEQSWQHSEEQLLANSRDDLSNDLKLDLFNHDVWSECFNQEQQCPHSNRQDSNKDDNKLFKRKKLEIPQPAIRKIQWNIRDSKDELSSPEDRHSPHEPEHELFHLNSQSLEQLDYMSDIQNPSVSWITERTIELALNQFAAQLMHYKKLSDRLSIKRKRALIKSISYQQRIVFIGIVQSFLPPNDQLLRKMNQKITPTPLDLLKCMRVQIDDYEYQSSEQPDNCNDDQFEEVGRFDPILHSDICFKALQTLKSSLTNNNPIEDQQEYEFNIGYLRKQGIPQIYVQTIETRQQQCQVNKKNREKLREQLINIEMHCVFDALNEQLFKLRMPNVGFSGIGMNELSIALRDSNKNLIKQSQAAKIALESKHKVLDIIMDNRQLNEKLLMENYEITCIDSLWVSYAEESLSCFLEIVFLVEDQIFIDAAFELANLILK